MMLHKIIHILRIHRDLFLFPVTLIIMGFIALAICLALPAAQNQVIGGMLYPLNTETRQVMSLDGIWNFIRASDSDPYKGYRKYWYKTSLKNITGEDPILMPVPSSYNDITQDNSIRDHVGLVWYDRNFYVPKVWNDNNTRVWLRFSSVSYLAQVWINDVFVMNHEIGHLPFQAEVTSFLNYGSKNRITVACDNTLLPDTVPQGSISERNTDDGKKLIQSYSFDFFNYAGIHRPVTIYTTPRNYIEDITVTTSISGKTGIVNYGVQSIRDENITYLIEVIDKDDVVVATSRTETGTIEVANANFWWPYLMKPNPGYLYTLKVNLLTVDGDVIDIYHQRIGIRKISWDNTKFLINDEPVYLHGFGRHEDSDIRGKGLDLPLIIRDYNLIEWVGGNAYRTSHYPYADEIMDLADEKGIMIIDECPSVDTDIFSDKLLEKHKNSLTELIRRDKNRPSVIMWSIANEPRTQTDAAGKYFKKVVDHVKSLDTTRPVTIAIARGVSEDKAGQYLDIISFNRYNAWYSNTGRLDMITSNVISEAKSWHTKYNKPVLMSEYGADTMEGLHISPSYVWSEEFQVQMMSKHFQAFDHLRSQGFFIGEFIWNFADFKTAQTYTRVGGNKKGIFTRNRMPKASAHHLRKRYLTLANQLFNATLPDDLYEYVVGSPNVQNYLYDNNTLY